MEHKLGNLNAVKDVYSRRENIMQYLKQTNGTDINTLSDILISYDFQAGSYIQHYRYFTELRKAFSEEFAGIIDSLGTIDSLLEAGVGEAVSMGNVLKYTKHIPSEIYAFDLSWSRIKYAQTFLRECDIDGVQLFTGDLFCMPLRDHSIDVVYTVHAIEPNGGREREALAELYRVAKKYVVLLEPAYELADEEAKARMRSHGYITELHATAIDMGYTIVDYRLMEVSLNPQNPTGIMIIRKDEKASGTVADSPLCCPITKAPLKKIDSVYYSHESMLAYPLLNDVPCLLPQNAIVATHFNDFINS